MSPEPKERRRAAGATSRKGGGARNRQSAVRAWIETEIMEGRLRPGERLDEARICARFGISRTPLREALLQLASMDLITFRPRRGAAVARMSVKQIAAMWEALTALEGLCAELAARRMMEEERELLRAVHAAARQLEGSNDAAAYDEANRRFHETIYDGCRNDYLAAQVRDIRRRLRVYRRYPFQRAGGIARSLAGHEMVLAAIVAGQDRAADAAMREHVAGGLSVLDLVAEIGEDEDERPPRLPPVPAAPAPRPRGESAAKGAKGAPRRRPGRPPSA